MARLAVLLVFTVAIAISAKGQLAAPSAFSDFGACSHDTCTWVPEFAQKKAYQRGDLTYTVKVSEDEDSGTFELRRGEKILLSTELKDLSASVSVVWSTTNEWFAVTWSNGVESVGSIQESFV